MQRVTNMIPSVYPGENFNEYEYTREQLSKYNPDSHACQRCGKRIWFSKMCDLDHWDISPSTLYEWKKRFETHYEEWCRACHKIRRLADAALSDAASVPAFPENFHKLHDRCFLQCCERVSSLVTLPLSISPGFP